MNTGKALLGVLAGITAGAVIGLLFAPEKGRDTRKTLLAKGGDLAHDLNSKIDEKFNELVEAVAGKVRRTNVQNDVATPKGEKVS